MHGRRYTNADCETTLRIVSTSFVFETLGHQHYAFACVDAVTPVPRCALGLRDNPDAALDQHAVLDAWVASEADPATGAVCIAGDDLLNMDFNVGFADDQQAALDGLCF